jgi:hypothetical protein
MELDCNKDLEDNNSVIIINILTPVRDRRGILLEQKIQQMARPAGDSQKKSQKKPEIQP